MAQYPGEKEVTFPPYTCLESHGDPRVEQTEEGELIIFPLKAPPPSPLPHFPPSPPPSESTPPRLLAAVQIQP